MRLPLLSQLTVEPSISFVFAQGALSMCCWLTDKSEKASSMTRFGCEVGGM